MSDEPETIWAWDDLHHVESNPHNHFATEYRRADLPPTIEQALNLPEIKALVEALGPLAAIADAYDANELDDEARKFFGRELEHTNTQSPADIELYQGRGGKQLLTLADCMIARAALEALGAK